ncbi:Uma2 family endonuclease [Kitasatospora purpeofusca]|uniref:Uma2 family endonuclease n=1 Tax=Kitasatospora purpeofusca TaxID=67352 RepID=UPI0035E2D3D8
MSAAPRLPSDYSTVTDPERALKYAIQHVAGDRAEIIEGVITPVSTTWAHESAAEVVRRQLTARLEALGLVSGAGSLDLPGSENRFIPDLAVVPADLAAKTEGQYGAPIHLLVDRRHRACTVFSEPTRLGYAVEDGPHAFGVPVRLPAPFELDLDTSRL